MISRLSAPDRPRRLCLITMLTTIALISGCTSTIAGQASRAGEGSPGSVFKLDRPEVGSGDSDTDAYPIEVDHAFGSTTIDMAPQRIVTLGAVERDAVLGLGATNRLVGIGVPTYDPDIAPWIEDLVDTDNLEQIEWTPGNDTVNYEDVAVAEPDVIIAATGMLTDEQYETLSQIAPTIGHLADPVHDAWQDVTALVGEILAMEDDAAELISDAESGLDDFAAAYPGLEGKTATFTYAIDDENFATLINPEDVTLDILDSLGFTLPPDVESAPESTKYEGYVDTDLDDLALIDADLVLVTYYEENDLTSIEDSAPFKELAAVNDGGYQALDLPAASAWRAPSALSLHWLLNDVSETLAAVAG